MLVFSLDSINNADKKGDISMKVIIIYVSKYGCAEKCVKKLAEKLDGAVDLCNLKSENNVEIWHYDTVIIGGSIYMSSMQKEITAFCTQNENALKEKKVALFTCGMRDGSMAEEQLNNAFSKSLIEAAIAKECFGGEFIFGKMKFIDRLIAKKVSGAKEDISNILEENIDKLAQAVNTN